MTKPEIFKTNKFIIHIHRHSNSRQNALVIRFAYNGNLISHYSYDQSGWPLVMEEYWPNEKFSPEPRLKTASYYSNGNLTNSLSFSREGKELTNAEIAAN